MLQQYVNCELPDFQAGFRKGRGTRDQIANIHWIVEKAREFQKNIYFWFIDYAKAFDCVDHNKWWKILQEMGIPDHLICLLRNLYAGQKATVRTRNGTDWLQIGKEVWQGCILSPCLFNFYAEYVCMKLTQLCLTLSNPMDCSPQGFSVYGILQARILEWVAIPFSSGSSWPRGRSQVPHIAGILYHLSYQGSIMWNAGLCESQAGITIARRNINNLRYADDTTLMAEN